MMRKLMIKQLERLAEDHADQLIADCKADIKSLEGRISFFNSQCDFQAADELMGKLARQQIALASLTAEPWGASIDNNGQYVDTYLSPPVPVIKPVKLPDGFAPSTDNGSGGMKPSIGGYWLSKVDVVKAIREAGIQIEGEE